MKKIISADDKLRFAVLLMALNAFVVATANVFFKLASGPIGHPGYLIIIFIIGILLNFITFFIVILAYKFGDFSTVYPIGSLSNVIYLLFAFWLFGEPLTFWKIFSILNIMIGIFLISGQK